MVLLLLRLMRIKLLLLVFTWLLTSATVPFLKDNLNYAEELNSKVVAGEKSTEQSNQDEAQIYSSELIVSMPAAPVSMASMLFILFILTLTVHIQKISERHFFHDPHFVLMVTKQRIWPGQAP